MLHVVTTGAYYPPLVTTWKIFTTGAPYLTTGNCALQSVENFIGPMMGKKGNFSKPRPDLQL